MFVRPLSRHIRLSHLPKDVFFCLCLLLDMKTVLNMKSTSKHFNRKMSRLINDKHFWKELAEHKLHPDQLASITDKDTFDYKQLLTTHLSPIKALSLHFDNSDNYRSNLAFNFLTNKRVYQNRHINLQIDLDEIKNLLINDTANKLLRKTSRVGDIIPFVNRDNFNKAHILKIMSHIEKDASKLLVADANFIHLVPLIIQFRAIKSFDLFVQSYLALVISLPPIETVSAYALNNIYQYIVKSNDDYFIQRFISLTLDVYPTDKADLYTLIKLTIDNGKSNLVINAIESLTTDRKTELFTDWRKMFVFDTLIHNLYPTERSRYTLNSALKTAIKLLEENNTLDINQLMEMKGDIQTGFDNFIKALSQDNISPAFDRN